MRTKRVEYEYGSIGIDKDLEETIQDRANGFVANILDGIGSEYLIPDLEPLIMGAVLSAITDKAVIETQESLMKEWEKNAGWINKDEEYETPDDIYFDEHNEARDEQETEEDLGYKE